MKQPAKVCTNFLLSNLSWQNISVPKQDFLLFQRAISSFPTAWGGWSLAFCIWTKVVTAVANHDYQPDSIQNHLETKPWAYLWRIFQTGLTEVGRPTLNLDSTIPGAGVMDQIKIEKKRSDSIHLSAFWLQIRVTSRSVLLPRLLV